MQGSSLNLSLKPRQVLLSSASNSKMKLTNRHIKPREKHLLLLSIAQYLETNAFPKTLKKFRVEAQLQEDDVKCSLDLEDMYLKYLETCDGRNQIKENKTMDAVGELEEVEVPNNHANDVVSGSKKGKKRNRKRDSGSVIDPIESGTDLCSEGNKVANAEPVYKTKDKKKKKTHEHKSASIDVHGKNDSVNESEPGSLVNSNGIPSEDKNVETKKKKKKKVNSEVDLEKSDVHVTDKEGDKTSNGGQAGKSKDISKKRRLNSEDNVSDKQKTEKGSKRRKIEGSEEFGVAEPLMKITPLVETGEGDTKANSGQLNGKLEENGKDPAKQMSDKKESKSSAQEKKPFQRVNVDEVVFFDERLQDNSYWAKGGADNGYGAKAQEVLGQVRGRDFRHEKTKKKRGSYRGGQIDLQSHSVKFNFSDDE